MREETYEGNDVKEGFLKKKFVIALVEEVMYKRRKKNKESSTRLSLYTVKSRSVMAMALYLGDGNDVLEREVKEKRFTLYYRVNVWRDVLPAFRVFH